MSRIPESAPRAIVYPDRDGRPFLTFQELGEERNRLARERDQERARADRLAAKLRELGVDLD